MSPAMQQLQRGLIHAVKHALAAWEKYLGQCERQINNPVKGTPMDGAPERTSGA